MDAWADGLNYYLHTHPQVKPRADHAIRAVDGAQLQRRQHRRRHRDGSSLERARRRSTAAGAPPPWRWPTHGAPARRRSRGGSNGFAIAPANTANGHALLLINPHTSFYFRPEVQMTSEEGLNAYGAVTWGQFFIYQGFNERAGLDAHLGRRRRHRRIPGNHRRQRWRCSYRYGGEQRAADAGRRSPCRTRPADGGMASEEFTVYCTHHGPVVRAEDGKWVAVRLMNDPVKALTQSYIRTKATRLRGVLQDDGAAHEFVEQHGVRRCRRQHRLLPRQFHPAARPALRLDASGGRQRPGHRVAGPAHGGRNDHAVQSAERLDPEHQQLALHGGRRRQPEARRTIPRTCRRMPRKRARPARRAGAAEQEGLYARQPDRRGVRQRPDRRSSRWCRR